MIPRSVACLSSGLFVVLAAVVLEAGGWVVITLQDLPDHVIAGRPVTLNYAVRQHGQRLSTRLNGWIEARAGSHVVKAAAVETPEMGHYSATLTLPHAGDWPVDIVSGFGGSYSTAHVLLSAIDAGAPAPVVSEAERGRRLFAAKGCLTCHGRRESEGEQLSVAVAVDLTAKHYQPAYIRQVLANPPKPKSSGWSMPDLELRDSEITALTAFIIAGR